MASSAMGPLGLSLCLCLFLVAVTGQSFAEFDYIVLGAGTAGCPLAARLVDAGFSVLLVEDGPAYPVRTSPNYLDRVSARPFAQWDKQFSANSYASEPNAAGARQRIMTGRGVGGSSIINAGLYTRPDVRDLDDWNLPGWSGAELLPYFLQLERYAKPGATNGHYGPLNINLAQKQNLADFMSLLLDSTGLFSRNPSQNGTVPVNSYLLTERVQDELSFFRIDSYTAFIAPRLRNPRLKLWVNTRATRIYARKAPSGKLVATEVSLITSGTKKWFARARKEIIISTGVFETPKLLLLSGIGDPAKFTQFGIPTLANLTQVGEQLVARPLQILAFSGTSLLPEQNFTAEGDLTAQAQFLNGNRGYFAYPAASITGMGSVFSPAKNDYLIEFTSTQPLFYIPAPAAHGIACVPTNVQSRGNIRLRSANPFDSARVNPNAYSDPRDFAVAIGCVQTFRGLIAGFDAATGGSASSTLGAEIIPGPTLQDNEDLAAYIYATSTYSYHAYGTARMGADPATSVVDTDLKVHGFENLRVADTSVIPGFFSSGPLSLAYAIGAKAAELVLQADYKVSFPTDVGPSDNFRLVRTPVNGTQASAACLELNLSQFNTDGANLSCAPREAPSALKYYNAVYAYVKAPFPGCNLLTAGGGIVKKVDCSLKYPVLCGGN